MAPRLSALSAQAQALRDLNVSIVVSAIPPALVQEALQATDNESKRWRALPAALDILVDIALGLRMDASATESLCWLLTGLDTLPGHSAPGLPVSSISISKVRITLGCAPLRGLCHRLVKPLAVRGRLVSRPAPRGR